MKTGNLADQVRGYFEAFRSGDRRFMETHLSDDFTFTSPYDDRIDKRAYFERCWPNRSLIRTHHIETVVASGNEAFVLYECELAAGPRFRNAERFLFENGKLRQVEVFFGDPPAGVAKDRYAAFLEAAQRAWDGGPGRTA